MPDMGVGNITAERWAYFDCFSGISGDMILGALIDVGVSREDLITELARIPVRGYRVEFDSVTKRGIRATKAKVLFESNGMRGSRGEGEESPSRSFIELADLIKRSSLDDFVKRRGISIFERLASAEARVHGVSREEVRLHETGALDALVDVMGAVIGLRLLGIDRIYSSPLHLGTGFVKCHHGFMPVPSPAVTELLEDKPVYSTGVRAELVTPTGAAIISTLAHSFGPMPLMTIDRVGYGAGDNDLEIPNVLRVILGSGSPQGVSRDVVTLLEANIDDMNPELYENLSSRALEEGACDVSIIPALMKKGRPAHLLRVIVSPDKADHLARLVLQETTTLGVRRYDVPRYRMERQTMEVESRYGSIRVKLGILDGRVVRAIPEYDDCRRLATSLGVPLQEVYYEALVAGRVAVGLPADVAGDETIPGGPESPLNPEGSEK